MIVALIVALIIISAMCYGPLAALMVELFPTRIRYTSMSLPYHIGNGWFGGFLPTVSFALVVYTGDIFYGLWYPVLITGGEPGGGDLLPEGNQGRGYRQGLRG